MCAMLILGIGLVGLTQGITTALSSSKDSEVQTAAALIAAGRIEHLRADGIILDGVDEGECGEGLSLYRWKETISSTNIDGLHEVTIEIENSKSGQVIYELKTMLFDPPLLSTQEQSADQKGRNNRRDRRGR
jgi:hypothetical protein